MKFRVDITSKHCESNDIDVSTYVVEHHDQEQVRWAAVEVTCDLAEQNPEMHYDESVREYREPRVISFDDFKRQMRDDFELEECDVHDD